MRRKVIMDRKHFAPEVVAPAIILGIDPGTRVTGWGVISLAGTDPRALACDIIAPSAKWPLEQRLAHIFSELGDVIARFSPTDMAVEEPFVGTNARSAMAIGEARTVAMLAATLAGVAVHHYAPARIKQMVAGYGQGEKTQVREMLRLQLGMAEAPADLNASDALAVALCHAMQHQANTLIAAADGGRASRLLRK
ncbi:MAG: crossover junction endodeoxyribonuclease RuvC [Chloroflexota bacterium]|nr:crossover junction endodeoxyribonuclease RuvC [Chloroflexota bacterium]